MHPSSDTQLCKKTLCAEEVLQSWKLFPRPTLTQGLQRALLTLSHCLSVSLLPSFLPSFYPSLASLHQCITQQLGLRFSASPDLALYTQSQRDNNTGSSRQKDGFLPSADLLQHPWKSGKWAGRVCNPLGCAVPLCSASWIFPTPP